MKAGARWATLLAALIVLRVVASNDIKITPPNDIYLRISGTAAESALFDLEMNNVGRISSSSHNRLDLLLLSKSLKSIHVLYQDLSLMPITKLLRQQPEVRFSKIYHLVPGTGFLLSTMQSMYYKHHREVLVSASGVFQMRFLLDFIIRELGADVESPASLDTFWRSLLDESFTGCLLCQFYRDDLESLKQQKFFADLQVVEVASNQLPPSFPITFTNSPEFPLTGNANNSFSWQTPLIKSSWSLALNSKTEARLFFQNPRQIRAQLHHGISRLKTWVGALTNFTATIDVPTVLRPFSGKCSDLLRIEVDQLARALEVNLQTGVPPMKFVWDGSPMLNTPHKWMFWALPKNSCSQFKKLLMHMDNRKREDVFKADPEHAHNPDTNKLPYLFRLPLKEARAIMESDKWTQAIFFRDPFERLLSAYLDKVARSPFWAADNPVPIQPSNRDLLLEFPDTSLKTGVSKNLPISFREFINRVERGSPNSHWDPQCEVVNCARWLPHMTFVGSIGSAAAHAKQMLQGIGPGVWDAYGATGWGQNFDWPFLVDRPSPKNVRHATNAHEQISQFYENPHLVHRVRSFYRLDVEYLPSYVYTFFPSFPLDFWAQCRPTTHILLQPPSKDPKEPWELSSFYCDEDSCVRKSMGGDEYFIYILSAKTPGIATDQKNGRYSISFYSKTSSVSIRNPKIQIVLLHSCGQSISTHPSVLQIQLQIAQINQQLSDQRDAHEQTQVKFSEEAAAEREQMKSAHGQELDALKNRLSSIHGEVDKTLKP